MGIRREYPTDISLQIIEQFFDFNYFKSIDLYGDEVSQPIENFKNIFRIAKSKGLKLKAHIGEYGKPESIQEAVEILELDEVQHGISASQSKSVMNFLKNNHIQLNICPTSNYRLNLIDKIKNHPIRKLFDKDISITINTDDFLIFKSCISKEFLLLYNNKLFSKEELNKIRLNGIKGCNHAMVQI